MGETGPQPQDGYAGRAVQGVVWTTAHKWAARMTGLVTIAILARLLSPEDFGLVAVAMTITPFVYLLADLGFSSYLVQASSPPDEAFSTAFWYAAGSGFVLAAVLWVVGPLAEALLGVDDVAKVIAALSPAVLAVALGSVPTAILKRDLRFGALAIQGVVAALVGQIVAVCMALAGFGVWALVTQAVVAQAVMSVMVWRVAAWRPSVAFDTSEFRRMVHYGVSVVAVELVGVSRLWAENAIVASVLGLRALGYLTIAQRLIQITSDLTIAAITPVSTVVFALIRENATRLASAYTRAQQTVYAVVIPAMVFVVVGAPEIVPLVFGEQWDGSVLPAQALAIAGILVVGATLDHGLFYGVGRPGLWLVYAVAIDLLTVAVTFAVVREGLAAVALGFVGSALVATIIRWPLVAARIGVSPWPLALAFLRAVVLGVLLAALGFVARGLVTEAHRVALLVVVAMVISTAWLVLVRWLVPEAAADLMRLARRLPGVPSRRRTAV